MTHPRPKWRGLILQGLAVLGGVLVALGADALWDYRVERAQERD